MKYATLENIDQINGLLLLSKSYWGYDNEFLDCFMKKFGITTGYMMQHVLRLFYVDDCLAGFFNFGFNAENLFELDNFFLHPHFIGKGLGRELWEACCQEARKQGKNEFIVWSEPHAEGFYLKMGCEKIGVRLSPMMPNRYPPVLRYKICDQFDERSEANLI